MTQSLEILSTKVNAKINIGLHIVGKRPDGYHNLQTIFYPTDFFYDNLTVKKSEKELVFLVESSENIGTSEDNLCVKAFRLLQKKYGISGVEISLTKGIPSGAGIPGPGCGRSRGGGPAFGRRCRRPCSPRPTGSRP